MKISFLPALPGLTARGVCFPVVRVSGMLMTGNIYHQFIGLVRLAICIFLAGPIVKLPS